ncbi:MAG: hypothetical protein ABL878_02130 [Burkholderiales bacterium]
MRCKALRLTGQSVALVFVMCLFSIEGTCAAEKKRPGRPAGTESAGMYSNYIDEGLVRYDKYLGDTHSLTEKDLVPALLSAVDQLSKYPKPSQLPEIYRVAHRRLEEMVCPTGCPVLATYRPGEGIFLDETLTPETDLFHRSVLLHELVHYVQDLNNELSTMRDCERWYHREQEAYAIQKTFLTIVGSQVRVGYSAKQSTCDDTAQATKNLPPH